VRELDLNPVFAYSKGVMAVDTGNCTLSIFNKEG